jgi:hypothetical protein
MHLDEFCEANIFPHQQFDPGAKREMFAFQLLRHPLSSARSATSPLTLAAPTESSAIHHAPQAAAGCIATISLTVIAWLQWAEFCHDPLKV